jgi:small conductance mechanosensitive channel
VSAEELADQVSTFWENYGGQVLQSLLVVVVAVVVWWIVRAAGRRWLRRMQANLEMTAGHDDLERAQRLATLWSVAESALAIAVISLSVLTLLGVWGIPLGPFIAAGSVIGIALGFGAQDYIKSVIAGLFIIIEDQYSVGDVVELAGVSGTVEEIRLRTTVLRDLDGNVHHIPNGVITVASNTTSGFSRLVVDLGVAYREDVDHVIDVVADELARFTAEEEWSEAFLEEPEILGVDALGDWSVTIRVLFTLTTLDRWRVKREFLRRAKARFDAEGIEIPFPYLTVVRAQD